ncbi:MAG: pseudouridine synthase [bacterium]|jgi:23S rRNA pseudouridine2605 synthase
MKNNPQKKPGNPTPSSKIRLNRLLAHYGLCSRRKADEWITAGRVAVDGVVIRELGTTVDPETESVTVDGKVLRKPPRRIYLALNKPRGYVTTRSDPQGRKIVYDLLPAQFRQSGVFSAGRLDADSEGLLLLTNDGDWNQILLHPSHQVWKEYRIKVNRSPDAQQKNQLEQGVILEGKKTIPARVTLHKSNNQENWFTICIREGRKRQIRRMCEMVGLKVLRLIRTAVGPVKLGSLPSGKWRELSIKEVDNIKNLAKFRSERTTK